MKDKGCTLLFPFLYLCVWKMNAMAGIPTAILNHTGNALTLGRWRGQQGDPEILMIVQSLYNSSRLPP